MFAAFFLSIGLAFSPSLQTQFTLPKLVGLRASASAIAIVWLLRLRRGAIQPIPATVALPATALVAWWVITLPFAAHLHTALWGMPGRYNGFVNQLTLILIFLAVASMRLGRRDVVRLLQIFVMALVPLAAYAIAQGLGLDWYSWPNPRPGSTIGHPVPLAAILAMGLPIALALALTSARRIAGAAWVAIMALLLFATGTTLSRGPWIGGAIAVSVVLLAALRRGAPGRARIWIIVAAITLGVVGTVSLGRVPGTRVTQRIALLTRLWTDPSFMNRFVFFKAATAMVRDHPVVGVGFESFGLLYPRYRPVEGEALPEDTVPSMVHNGYLQLAVTTGVPGLAIYLMLVSGLLLLMWRVCTKARAADGNKDEATLAAGLAGAVAGFLIQDLSGWLEVSSSAFFWTIAGAAVSFHTAGTAVRSWSLPKILQRAVVAVVAAMSLFFAGLASDAMKELRADRALYTAQRLNVASDWPVVLSQLNEGLELAPDDARYLDEAGVLHLERLYASSDARTYEDGAALLERARRSNPFDPYTLIHRIDLESAALHANIIETPSNAALVAVTTALAMDPNNSSVHESVARFQMAAGHPAAALTAIETARTLRPTHVGYRITEGDILRALGQRSQSIDAYRSEVTLHPTPDAGWVAAEHKLIAALVEAADYRSAVVEGLTFVKRQPDDATGHVLLGIAYRGLNEGESAKVAFAAALAIDPANAAARQGQIEAEQERKRQLR